MRRSAPVDRSGRRVRRNHGGAQEFGGDDILTLHSSVGQIGRDFEQMARSLRFKQMYITHSQITHS